MVPTGKDWLATVLVRTNKTSDLFQADEAWWQSCFAEGRGQVSYGKVEYDESAGSEAISAYVPIYQDKKLIGVSKAVVNVTALQRG